MELIVKIFNFIFSVLFNLVFGFVEFLLNLFLDVVSSMLAAFDVFGLFSDLFDREKRGIQKNINHR